MKIFLCFLLLLNLFIFANEDNTPHLVFDTEGHKAFIGKMVFTKDEKYLVTGSQDKFIKVWDIKTGIFTYSFLSGIKNYQSDFNKDKKIQISEIMNWVYDKVINLTDGWQTPTLRREKLEFDFSIY